MSDHFESIKFSFGDHKQSEQSIPESETSSTYSMSDIVQDNSNTNNNAENNNAHNNANATLSQEAKAQIEALANINEKDVIDVLFFMGVKDPSPGTIERFKPLFLQALQATAKIDDRKNTNADDKKSMEDQHDVIAEIADKFKYVQFTRAIFEEKIPANTLYSEFYLNDFLGTDQPKKDNTKNDPKNDGNEVKNFADDPKFSRDGGYAQQQKQAREARQGKKISLDEFGFGGGQDGDAVGMDGLFSFDTTIKTAEYGQGKFGQDKFGQDKFFGQSCSQKEQNKPLGLSIYEKDLQLNAKEHILGQQNTLGDFWVKRGNATFNSNSNNNNNNNTKNNNHNSKMKEFWDKRQKSALSTNEKIECAAFFTRSYGEQDTPVSAERPDSEQTFAPAKPIDIVVAFPGFADYAPCSYSCTKDPAQTCGDDDDDNQRKRYGAPGGSADYLKSFIGGQKNTKSQKCIKRFYPADAPTNSDFGGAAIINDDNDDTDQELFRFDKNKNEKGFRNTDGSTETESCMFGRSFSYGPPTKCSPILTGKATGKAFDINLQDDDKKAEPMNITLHIGRFTITGPLVSFSPAFINDPSMHTEDRVVDLLERGELYQILTREKDDQGGYNADVDMKKFNHGSDHSFSSSFSSSFDATSNPPLDAFMTSIENVKRALQQLATQVSEFYKKEEQNHTDNNTKKEDYSFFFGGSECPAIFYKELDEKMKAFTKVKEQIAVCNIFTPENNKLLSSAHSKAFDDLKNCIEKCKTQMSLCPPIFETKRSNENKAFYGPPQGPPQGPFHYGSQNVEYKTFPTEIEKLHMKAQQKGQTAQKHKEEKAAQENSGDYNVHAAFYGNNNTCSYGRANSSSCNAKATCDAKANANANKKNEKKEEAVLEYALCLPENSGLTDSFGSTFVTGSYDKDEFSSLFEADFFDKKFEKARDPTILQLVSCCDNEPRSKMGFAPREGPKNPTLIINKKTPCPSSPVSLYLSCSGVGAAPFSTKNATKNSSSSSEINSMGWAFAAKQAASLGNLLSKGKLINDFVKTWCEVPQDVAQNFTGEQMRSIKKKLEENLEEFESATEKAAGLLQSNKELAKEMMFVNDIKSRSFTAYGLSMPPKNNNNMKKVFQDNSDYAGGEQPENMFQKRIMFTQTQIDNAFKKKKERKWLTKLDKLAIAYAKSLKTTKNNNNNSDVVENDNVFVANAVADTQKRSSSCTDFGKIKGKGKSFRFPSCFDLDKNNNNSSK